MKTNNGAAQDNSRRQQTSEPAHATDRLRVGITHGDFNGIGYEVILKMLDDARILELCTPIIYGSAKIAAFYRKGLDLQGPWQPQQIATASQAAEDTVNIINVIGQEAHITPGEATKEAGEAAFIALERAVEDLKNGDIDVLVTAPINKNTIQSETFRFPGHTEYLAASAADESKPLMILFNENIRVALVTTHLPLAKVPEAITTDGIVEKLVQFNSALVSDFTVVKPRIAVLSLNPHSGEQGLLGSEETDTIIPAIEQARQMKIDAFGPYAADGFFGNGLYTKFDGVLAMYHDQGLAPFKTLAMDSGVNYTAGLPFVRTSPDHGTGYDIAGKNLASEGSIRSALYAAIDIFRSRQTYNEITASPLPKLYHEKGRDNVVLNLSNDRLEQKGH